MVEGQPSSPARLATKARESGALGFISVLNMLARRLFSPTLASGLRAYSTAPLQPPHGTASPDTYGEDRAAAEAYAAKEGWDMDSLIEQPVVSHSNYSSLLSQHR